MPLVTLTTDFGTDSPYVAQLKGRLLTGCPQLTIVDLTHAIPPQDIRRGALALGDSVEYFPEGTLHLAVVDPGVGTDRSLVYVECRSQRFLAPDNGLLDLVARRWPPSRIISLDNREFWSEHVAPTFHGRDILAPVAACLARGLDPLRLGRVQSSLIPLDWPSPLVMAGRMIGQVVAIDAFGNLLTNIEAQLLPPEVCANLRIHCAGCVVVEFVRTYGERPAGTLVALFGSSGRLELAEVQGSAARRLTADVGTSVEVEFPR